MNTPLGIAIFLPVITALVTGFVTVAAFASRIMATELTSTRDQPALTGQIIAQSTETGCRQAQNTTGVYTQPNLDSGSRGVINSGQTVRLDLTGSGTGWARITEPMIGWVEAKYLTPMTACTGLGYTPAPGATATTSSATPAPSSTPAATATVSAVCEVLPTEGLVVRSEPTIAGNTALHTIPKGRHQFQFTSNQLTTHSGSQSRYWTYITAPYQGWISLGVAGGRFNLGGRECG